MHRFYVLAAALTFIFLVSCDTNVSDNHTPKECEYTVCGQDCVNTQISNVHCGECGKVCETNSSCINGLCQASQKDCGDKFNCNGICVDLLNDSNHCGECNTFCGNNMLCQSGFCICKEGYIDYDKNTSNGCELSLDELECEDGDVMECYTGPSETAGIGSCKKGTRLCSGGNWEFFCVGQVIPTAYDPKFADYDLNCNGIPDKDEDLDGDGYTKGGGDCCDDKISCNVADPERVNPGALEVPDDGIDNNCNGVIDEEPECIAHYDNNYPQGILANSALALLHAMDLCMPVVSEESGLAGLIDFRVQSKEDGRAIDPVSAFALSKLVSKDAAHQLLPKKGPSFALLSSGEAKDAKNGFEGEYTAKSGKSEIPRPYYNAHGGQLQTASGCVGNNSINDMASLYVKMRVPSNAKGFKFKFRFFSVEYPRYVCSEFNDFFLVLLNSSIDAIPADKNISFDKLGNPVSVNNAFFTSCIPIQCGGTSQCPSNMVCDHNDGNICKTYVDPSNPSLGFNEACPDGVAGDHDTLTFHSGSDRGGTAWLETSAPVVPGEVITLTFYIWDTGDQVLDSTVILDDFEWSFLETELGTIIVN
ncbi:MAG: choice-of-anchor L domain-containing protein [Bradymonadales bacterium]|jgi:hypothetical protein